MDTAKQQIPTQKNLSDVAKSIVSNIEAASEIINAALNSIKIIVNSKIISVATAGKIALTKTVLIEYSTMMLEIVNVYTQENENGKKIDELLGRVKVYDKNKDAEVTSFTTVDCVFALQKMMNYLIETIEKVGSPKTVVKLYIATKLSKLTFVIIGEFINYLNKELSDKKLENLPDLSKLVKLVKQINDLSKSILLCALLAIPATLAIIVVSLYMVALVIFIKIVNYIFTKFITEEITEEIIEGVKRVRTILLLSLWIGFIIVLMAILTPVVILGMIVVSLMFVAMVALMYVIKWAAKVISKVAEKALKDVIKGCLLLTIIFMVVMVAAVAMLILAVVAFLIDKMDAVGGIIALLLGIIIIGTVLILVSAGLTALLQYIGPCFAGLAALALVFIALGVIALVMMIVVFTVWVIEKMNGYEKITMFILGLIPIVLSLTVLSVVLIPFLLLSPSLLLGLLAVIGAFVELIIISILMLIVSGISMLLESMDAYSLIISLTLNLMLIVGTLTLLGLELALLSPVLGLTLAGLLTVAVLFGELLIIGTVMAGIAALDLDESKMEKIKDITTSIMGYAAYVAAASSGAIEVEFAGQKSTLGASSWIKLWQAKRTLSRVSSLTEKLLDVAVSLKKLQDLDLNADKVANQVTSLFELVFLIEEHVERVNAKFNSGSWLDFSADEEDAEETIESIKSIVDAIKSMGDSMIKLIDMKLSKSKITKKVDDLFELVDIIETKIERVNAKYNSGGWFDFSADEGDAEETIGAVTSIVECLQDMTKALNSIMEMKLKKQKIIQRMDDLFELVDHIKTKIDILNEKYNSGGWLDGLFGPDEEDAEETIGAVSSVVNCMKSMTEALNSLVKIRINKDKVLAKVDDTFEFIQKIKDKINAMNAADSGGRGGLAGWWNRWRAGKRMEEAAEQMGQIGQVIGTLNTTCTALTSIEKIKIKKDKILPKIDEIFTFIKDIKDRITALNKADAGGRGGIIGWFNRWRARKQVEDGAEQIGKIAEVVGSMDIIVTSLNNIEKINLNKDKVLGKITDTFTFVHVVKDLITKLGRSDRKDLDLSGKSLSQAWWLIKDEVERQKQAKKDFESGVDQMGVIGEVMGNINIVIDSLNSIKDFKMDEKGVMKKIAYIFGFAKYVQRRLIDYVNQEQIKSSSSSVVNSRATISKKEYMNKSISEGQDMLESASATAKLISDIIGPLKDLEELKLNENKVMKKLQKIFDTVTRVQDSLIEFSKSQKAKNEEFNKANTTGDLSDALEPIYEVIDTLTGKFDAVAKIDSDKLTKNFKSGAMFINTVNKLNVEKVKTVSNMFEQMANFAKEIDGNFDGLAEALGDKLVPVLEELKNVMQQIPDKLDVGFQNTSASIAAAGAPPTAENMAAQINRENPNLSKAETDAMVSSRMSERAMTESTGVAAKLDQLISLLKGYGEPVVVRTV